VRLYRARNGASPIAWGLLRWHVALPDLLAKRLNRRELRALLAHELAHLVRGDTRWLWLASVIGSLGFIQPLNKLAQRRICREAELLSDRWAVARTGDRLALARSLTAVAELLLGPTAALAAGAASTRSALHERLEILLDERPLAPPGSHRGARSLAAVVAVVVALGGVSLLPAAKLPAAAVVTSASATLAPSIDLDEVVGGLWQEIDQLGVELGQLQRVLASAEQGETSEPAERIHRQWLALGERRDELRGQLESLTIEE
jgi:beta-lactamase regulating signal transducer with metallopeptidase domain